MLRLINDFYAHQIENRIPFMVQKMPNVELLSICTPDAANFQQLSKLPYLQRLEINQAFKNVPLIEHYIEHKQLKALGLEHVDDSVILAVTKIKYLQVLKLTQCSANEIFPLAIDLPELRELYLFKCNVVFRDILWLVQNAEKLEKLVINTFETDANFEYVEWKKLDRQCGRRQTRLCIFVNICDLRVDETKLLEWNYKNVQFQREASNKWCYENDCFSIRTSIDSKWVERYDELLDDLCDDDDEDMDILYESEDS